MKIATKKRMTDISVELFNSHKDSEANCMATFMKETAIQARELVLAAINEGHRFSTSRFDPVGNSVFMAQNRAYSLFCQK